MSRYSYKNVIIIATNVIMFKFLSVQSIQSRHSAKVSSV